MSSKSSIFRAFFMLLFLVCTSVLSVSAVSLIPKILNSLGMTAYVGTQHYTGQHITPQLMISQAKLALDSLHPLPKKDKPSVVSALWAGGDEIFFASSAKGKGTVPGDDELHIATPVLAALKKCGANFDRHKFDGKCGEIMVISQWLQENPGKSLPKDKIIVAVNDRGVLPPCRENKGKKTYGCAGFLQEMKFNGNKIIKKEPKTGACELSPPGSPKGSLGDRACRRPRKGTEPTKSTKAPKKGKDSKPKGTKPAPRRS